MTPSNRDVRSYPESQFSQNNATRSLPSRPRLVTPCWPVLAQPSQKSGRSVNVVEVGVPMDSLQDPLNDQYHNDGIVALVPEPMAVKARPGGPTRDPDDQYVSTTISPRLIDVTAEETCPAVQMSAQDGAPQLAPAIQTAQAPSATTFELMSKLEALASDLAVKGCGSSDQCTGNVHEESKVSSGLQAVEPSIRVSPRPTGFESDQFASDRPSTSRRTVLALASFFMAAVIGLGVMFAWHSHGVWTMQQPNDVDVAAEQQGSAPAGQLSTSDAAPPQSVLVTQTATAPVAPATSPELMKQLEAMTQDLASVRRGVEELAAKQEHLAAAQQQLEQLAAKQEQLSAKQEQLAQNIAKLQALGQNARLKMSPPPQPRAVPIPPRAPPEPAAQLSSVPRSAPHPVPPLPVPP
jgi:hypothetical protein